jgi:hypothetical protein
VKGIAQTALLLLGWSTMTRWLLGIGLALTGLGLCGVVTGWQPAAQPLFVVLALFGVITAVISPLLMGAVVFRSLAAPRGIQMIRNGRLKLLLGAAVAQLAIAAFISGVVTVMVTAGSFAEVFMVTYAAATLQFLGYFLASRTRLGGFWLLTLPVWARVVRAALDDPQVRTFLATPSGMGGIFGISLLAWLAFASGLLVVRQIELPHWNNFGIGAPKRPRSTPRPSRTRERHFTQREAIRTVLTGGPRQQRVLAAMLLGFFFIVLVTIMDRAHLPRGAGYAIIGLICMMAGPLTGSVAGVMSQRAKPLWLQSGLGRLELFAALEARSWRMVLPASIFCAALAGSLLALAGSPPYWSAWSVGVLVTPLASGALFTYAQLQFVRGRRVPDILLVALAIGLWMMEFFSVVARAEVSLVTGLLVAQIVLVPVLRVLALRRWGQLDWLIHRGARNPWYIT